MRLRDKLDRLMGCAPVKKMVVLKTATCVMSAEVRRHHKSWRSTREKPTTSAVAPFELLHEIHERVDPGFGKRVID